MMRGNTRAVCRAWAECSSQCGRNHSSSVYFDGDTIYSYGPHFPMARLFPDQKTSLHTEASYGNTTQKHKRMAHDAAVRAGWKTLPCAVLHGFDQHRRNIASYLDKMSEWTDRSTRARENHELYLRAVRASAQLLWQYVSLFNLTELVLPGRWATDTVRQLVRSAPDDSVPPVLADALQDAGCDDEALLRDLRCLRPGGKEKLARAQSTLAWARVNVLKHALGEQEGNGDGREEPSR